MKILDVFFRVTAEEVARMGSVSLEDVCLQAESSSQSAEIQSIVSHIARRTGLGEARAKKILAGLLATDHHDFELIEMEVQRIRDEHHEEVFVRDLTQSFCRELEEAGITVDSLRDHDPIRNHHDEIGVKIEKIAEALAQKMGVREDVIWGILRPQFFAH